MLVGHLTPSLINSEKHALIVIAIRGFEPRGKAPRPQRIAASIRSRAGLLIESAILGRGVALAKSKLAAADIEVGRLVRSIDCERPVDFAYYFVAPRPKLNLPKVVYFRDWLRRQTGNDGDQRAWWRETSMLEQGSSFRSIPHEFAGVSGPIRCATVFMNVAP
jgi:DNA-binding transcriptional LysR family regulator